MDTKTKALLAFAFLFMMGFASGFLLGKTAAPGSGNDYEYAEERPRPTPEEIRQRRQGGLARLLELTPEQQELFYEQMSVYRSSIRTELREMRSNENVLMIRHYEAMKQDVSDILTPAQLERLDHHLHPDSVMANRMNNRGRGRP
ncbi:MAG: hypothetical protein WDZ53_01960 [Balneolales bacterium]